MPNPSERNSVPRALPHRGVAQIEHDIACSQVADELFDRRKAQNPDIRRQTHRADHRFERKLRVRFAHQNHARVGREADQAAKRAQRFGDPLVRLEESEDTHQRRQFIQAEFVAVAVTVRRGNPGSMRDNRHRPLKPRYTDLPLHEAAVYNHALGAFEQPARHGQALVIGTHFQLAHTLGEFARRDAAVIFALANVRVPIAATDGQIGDQVMQIRFVQHHHTRMPQRRLINEIVKAVIADVVEDRVEARGIERLIGAGENLQIHQRPQRFDQCFGIIGDPAPRGRQRGEIRHTHRQRTSSKVKAPRLSGILIWSGVRAASRA